MGCIAFVVLGAMLIGFISSLVSAGTNAFISIPVWVWIPLLIGALIMQGRVIYKSRRQKIVKRRARQASYLEQAPQDRNIPIPEALSRKPETKPASAPISTPTRYNRDIRTQDYDIRHYGLYEQEIVGESHYQDAIQRHFSYEELQQDKYSGYFIFTILLEDQNPSDTNAVAILLDGETVGHLKRTDAKRYRKWLQNQALPSQPSCRGVVYGGRGKNAGIWLDLPPFD